MKFCYSGVQVAASITVESVNKEVDQKNELMDAKEIRLKSEITCPECGHKSTEEMSTNSCQFFWECPSCKIILKPKEGDCCVFCSYGDYPCPPIQKGRDQARSCC